MTTAPTTQDPKAGPSGLASAPQPAPPRQQRRRSVLALGIALIVLGVLAGAWYGTRTEQAESALVLNQDLMAGDVLHRDMLRSAPIVAGPEVTSIAVADVDAYVGLMASGNLPAGTLLTPQMFTDTLSIPDATSLVGVSLTPAQLPSIGVSPGDTVSVVVGASNVAGVPAAEETLTTPGRYWRAQVAAIGRPAQDTGLVTVDLAVHDDEATHVAAAAASGNISLVLHPHGQSTIPPLEDQDRPADDAPAEEQTPDGDLEHQTESPDTEDEGER